MFLNQLLDNEKKSFIDLALYVIYLDNKLAKEEERLFEQYSMEMALNINLSTYEREIDLNNIYINFEKSEKVTMRKIFIELVALIHSDNDIAVEEEKFIVKFMEKFNIDNKMYEESKDALSLLFNSYEQLNRVINA